jgi:hypothetical protein
MEEVTARARQQVMMEVDNNIALIAGNLQWILSQQLKPHPMYLLNIGIVNTKYF